MKISFGKLNSIFLLVVCFFALACPFSKPLDGDLEAVQTDGVQIESKRFENDTAVIETNNVTFGFHGNWVSSSYPNLLINILVSNNSKNVVVIKLSGLNLKSGNGEDGTIGDITKKEIGGDDVWLRHARKGNDKNTDAPEDVKLLPSSKNEFEIVFGTSASFKGGEKEKFFYLSLPIEVENMPDSRKDLKVTFKAVESKAGNKPYPVN